jgi:hypothetical protein
MNVAQRETLGLRGRYVRASPGGTIEASVVPPGLDLPIAPVTPALRAGLGLGRPYGTASTLKTYMTSAVRARFRYGWSSWCLG